MSLEEEFSKNRRIVNATELDFDYAHFLTFLKKHGKERAVGYMLALYDMRNCVDEMLNRRLVDGGTIPESPGRIHKKNIKLGIHFGEFLNAVKESGRLYPDASPQSPFEGGP